MYNYFLSYNLFKGNKKIASGDAVIESNNKILNNADFLEVKKKLEESCKESCRETCANFTFIQVLSLNYLGEGE